MYTRVRNCLYESSVWTHPYADVRVTREHQFVTRIEFAWLCVYVSVSVGIGKNLCTFLQKNIYVYIVTHSSFIDAPRALLRIAMQLSSSNSLYARSMRRFEDIYPAGYTNRTHRANRRRTARHTHALCVARDIYGEKYSLSSSIESDHGRGKR